jgi:hypothetical protein
MFCVVHIQRNVQDSFGRGASKCVFPLARTFSHMVAEDLLSTIPTPAREYLERITSSHWRNTAWLHDKTLSPRYGILTSNMSESSNNMFEESRKGSWLYSVHTMLCKISERIAGLREI